MTLVFRSSELFNMMYEQCLQEQLEVFAYASDDRLHINLAKQLIIIDTVIRMIHMYDKLLTKFKRKYTSISKVLFIVDESNYKFKILPLATVKTSDNDHVRIITSIELLQSISEMLGKISNTLPISYRTSYINIESFINQYGCKTLSFSSLASILPRKHVYTVEHYNKLSYVYNKCLSEALAPFQMRLTNNELILCMRLLLRTIATCKTYKTSFVTCNTSTMFDESVIQYIHTKHTKHIKQIIIAHNATQFPNNKSSYIVRDLSNITSYCTFNNLYEVTMLDINAMYNVKASGGNSIKYGFRNINIRNDISYVSNIGSYKHISKTLYEIFKQLDKVYCNTLMYINSYSIIGFKDFDNMYVNKTFKTLRTDVFDDIDLPLCNTDELNIIINNIVETFNMRMHYKLY